MGVGTPDDLLASIARGIDMFDCVMPTRNGRHGLAFTRFGPINIKNAQHADDPRPLDAESRCPAAREFSRAYLHHLFRAGEALGGTLLSIINLFYYQELMAGARAAIAAGRFDDFCAQTKAQWVVKGDRQDFLTGRNATALTDVMPQQMPAGMKLHHVSSPQGDLNETIARSLLPAEQPGFFGSRRRRARVAAQCARKPNIPIIRYGSFFRSAPAALPTSPRGLSPRPRAKSSGRILSSRICRVLAALRPRARRSRAVKTAIPWRCRPAAAPSALSCSSICLSIR